MKKYECDPCGYVYDPAEGDPEHGIAPGTAFEDLPEDWVCPICGAGKEEFKPVDCYSDIFLTKRESDSGSFFVPSGQRRHEKHASIPSVTCIEITYVLILKQ